jgi:ketosteroid isomerase-like protein
MGKHVDSFKVFEAKYQTYGDYESSRMKWGSPEELKQDATLTVKRVIPKSWDQAEGEIKSVTDQSDADKGIKFQFDLKSGDTLHLFKTGPMRGGWEIYLNRKAMRSPEHARDELMKAMKPLDRYLYFMPGYDSTWHYADDGRAYRAGSQQADNLKSLYAALSAGDKKKAYAAFNDRFKTETKFAEFTGA